MSKFDFSGWATRNDLRCSDGRTIMKDAFKDNNGQKVPLVWNHQHNEPSNVLGHALLENRDEGVYAYCNFNDTESGAIAKALVQHGDIVALSIYANQLRQNGTNVVHGMIREVSLVHAGANPGAFIDAVMVHGEAAEGEAIIYTGEDISLSHADENKKDGEEKKTEEPKKDEEKKTSDENSDTETVADVFNAFSEKQKTVVYAMISQALEDSNSDEETDEKKNNSDNNEGGNTNMKHNVFEGDQQTNDTQVLSHSEMQAVIADGKRYGSLRESAIAHGIENIDYLFPDAKNVTPTPQFIQRDTGWVKNVMNSIHHTPFSRIKSILADITEDDARAKGYIKGNLKKDEVFSLLKRTTSPTTVYKKQKLDRDDVVDITDFDVIAWLKLEMRGLLDEEIARAILVSDLRLSSSDDKIKEDCIRPIVSDDDLYTIKSVINVAADATDDDKAKAFIRSAIKSRKNYKGSGNPTLYTTEDVLTNCLLLEDNTGRTLYEDADKLAKKLRVKEIVTVPVMENVTGPNNGELMGIIVNLNDYNVGADKGGAVNLFDDFDIDYNAQKYLIETRCSGALIKPYSAIELEVVTAAG